jgi:hypothetical protein
MVLSGLSTSTPHSCVCISVFVLVSPVFHHASVRFLKSSVHKHSLCISCLLILSYPCIPTAPSPLRCGAATQRGSWPPHSWGFLDHTQRRTTVGRTRLDEWSARRRDLYLTTHNTHNKHPCPRWDSNLRSQQASGHRPSPYTARQWDRPIHFVTRIILGDF